MSEPLMSLKQYLSKGKVFEIPDYQRGYVWGKSKRDSKDKKREIKDSVTFFMDSLVNGSKAKSDLFLQGVTVSEQDNKIIIIDGQQRTTMLYLIMVYLGKANDFNIEYTVRKESDSFLRELKTLSQPEIIERCKKDENEEFQDIYYFKKSIRTISKFINEEISDISEFYKYLNEQEKFLYINIPESDAISVFTMMNGNKATMQSAEIVKADLLRLVSQKRDLVKDSEASRWDTNMVRSKYAREWDKWLRWWMRDDVKEFYNTKNVMGRLLDTFSGKNNITYAEFKAIFFEGTDSVKAAKDTFAKLRVVQKRFEDAFSVIELRNKIGAILKIQNYSAAFIQAYFNEVLSFDIDKYLKLTYLGMNHTDILKGDNQDIIDEAYKHNLEALENNLLYVEGDKEPAFRQLLRLNVQAATALDQRFEFNIWNNRSLEHIYAKSKADTLGKFTQDGDVHCIGNLVLLYKNDNSSFNASDFDDKKDIYFNLEKRKGFMSRNLLHTISIFAKKEWGQTEICNNKVAFIDEFKKHYESIVTIDCNE